MQTLKPWAILGASENGKPKIETSGKLKKCICFSKYFFNECLIPPEKKKKTVCFSMFHF